MSRRRRAIVQTQGVAPTAALDLRAFRFRDGDTVPLNTTFGSGGAALDLVAFTFRDGDLVGLNGEPGGSTSNPSGMPMPVGNRDGLTQIFADDFTTLDVALGSFPGASTSVYPGSAWNHYMISQGFKDTSKNGTYRADRCVSIEGDLMKIRMWTELGTQQAVTASASTDVFTCSGHGFINKDRVRFEGVVGGSPIVAGTTYYVQSVTTNTFKIAATHGGTAINITSDMTAGTVKLVRTNVAAPVPRILGLTGASTTSNAQLYGMYEICVRAQAAAVGFKMVPLLWPSSNVWPRDGEIDLPEVNLDGVSVVKGFHHNQDGTSGGDQVEKVTTALPYDWHRYRIKWLANYCAMYVDDVMIGGAITSRVPNTPMWWVLQFETVLNAATPPADGVEANIEIDWVVAYSGS